MQQIMKINGMTCSACAARVEKVTAKLAGVEKSSVNFASEKLTIDFDETKVSKEEIQSAIEKAGYQAILETIERNCR